MARSLFTNRQLTAAFHKNCLYPKDRIQYWHCIPHRTTSMLQWYFRQVLYRHAREMPGIGRVLQIRSSQSIHR
ncbi:hypothetical protein AFLA_002359 [Aspergillus flavus NRRL3357]|nr:hypothetical protein AFLA_002359 [Aspergillus flavus NRRL3357]